MDCRARICVLPMNPRPATATRIDNHPSNCLSVGRRVISLVLSMTPTRARGFTMSGHSKWATIKHKKAALDAKRGKAFTRIIKEIMIAARQGGDPDANPRLRTAVLAAKNVSMPADNIKKAIMRGTGELEGGQIEEVMFEGYGPGGAAVLVNVATDNRNRTVSEIRHAFSKNGGNMGPEGRGAWVFE